MHEQFDRREYAEFIGLDGPRAAHYEAVIEHLPFTIDRKTKLLDVGCGSGDFEKLLANRFADQFELTGFDPSGSLIEEAEAKNIPSARFFRSLSSDFSVADCFDVAVSILVLPYPDSTDELQKVFDVAARHLNEGGRFISVTFNPDFCIPDEQVLVNRRFERIDEKGIEVYFLSRAGDTLFQSHAHQWDMEVLKRVAYKADFSSVQWHTLYLDRDGNRISSKGMVDNRQPYGVLECIR